MGLLDPERIEHLDEPVGHRGITSGRQVDPLRLPISRQADDEDAEVLGEHSDVVAEVAPATGTRGTTVDAEEDGALHRDSATGSEARAAVTRPAWAETRNTGENRP